MAAVTICSDLEHKKRKPVTVSIVRTIWKKKQDASMSDKADGLAEDWLQDKI